MDLREVAQTRAQMQNMANESSVDNTISSLQANGNQKEPDSGGEPSSKTFNRQNSTQGGETSKRASKLVPQNTFFVILLSNLTQLIDNFVKSTFYDLVGDNMEKSKEIVTEFEKLKSDYGKRVESGTNLLSAQEQNLLNFLFTKIRYVLTRLGRIISIYDVILQRFKV